MESILNMNSGTPRRCEVLDIMMPRTYMVKFDMAKEDLLSDPHEFFVPNQLGTEGLEHVKKYVGGAHTIHHYVYCHP